MSERIILAGTERLLKPVIAQILAIHQLIDRKDIGNVYGIPIQSYQESVKFLPQCHLYFKQVIGSIDNTFGAVSAQVSFRIINESAETFTPAKALALAQKINTEFGGSSPYAFNKGKHLYSYYAPNQGMQGKFYTDNETTAKRIIRSVLGLQNLIFKDDYFKDATKTADLNTPADGNQGRELIYGESRKVPRRLPQAQVVFESAELLLHGLPKAICLVDMSGKKHEPLIKGYMPAGMQGGGA